MYKKKDLKNLIVFDIESLPKDWDTLSEGIKKNWVEKHHYKCYEKELEFQKNKFLLEKSNPETTSGVLPNFKFSFREIYIKYASLYAEFSKVWCISFGLFNDNYGLEINTIQEESEIDMLKQFCEVLNHYKKLNLAGYNIGTWDIPFLLTRMQINGLNENYPPQLQLKNSKPWTVGYVDFMNDWKGLRWEPCTLDLVCAVLGVDSPKEKFANYEFTTLMTNNKITVAEGIAYCEGDVKALGECMVKCSSENCNYGGGPPVNVFSKNTDKSLTK